MQPLTPAIASSLGVRRHVSGVVVTAVDPSSDAAAKGLQRGDMILSVNRVAVTTPAADGCCGRRGAPGRPHERAAARQARDAPGSVTSRIDIRAGALATGLLPRLLIA